MVVHQPRPVFNNYKIFYEKEEIVHADAFVGEISCQQKFFLTTFFLFFFFLFFPVKLPLSCYQWLVKMKNQCVSEKQVVLFLVSTRNVKRICNLISAKKGMKNVLLYVIKAMAMSSVCVHPIQYALGDLG